MTGDPLQAVVLDPKVLLKHLQSVLHKKRGKAHVIIMAAKGGRFGVTDAKHHAVSAEMPCMEGWKGTAEVNGSQMMKILGTLGDKDMASISKDAYCVTIKSATTSINLKRLDLPGTKKSKKKPLPHTGKVEHPPAPTTKRAEFGDTWGFSARVPLPATAYKDRFEYGE